MCIYFPVNTVNPCELLDICMIVGYWINLIDLENLCCYRKDVLSTKLAHQ